MKTLEIIDHQRNLVEMVAQEPDIAGCADQIVHIRDGAVEGQERIGG
ncbi:MAG: hypothetical protein WBC77_09800 [Candidatus Zixiibacteriota bacterium]